VVVTTGGALGEAARAAGVPVMGVPGAFQPRAAVVYMTVAALEAAAACGAAPQIRGEVEGAAPLLGGLAGEWEPDAPPDSEAKRLALALHGTVPVVQGAGATAAVALRWKTQFNENASMPAFASELPEADHNEVCGFAPPLAAVLLDDPALDERLRRRIELTADLLAPAAAAVERIEARGETQFERTMSLVLLGDLVSVYLAVLAGEDPTPVARIERLKERLG
jgi:glucose/mannose-6-phosphate isomerase